MSIEDESRLGRPSTYWADKNVELMLETINQDH